MDKISCVTEAIKFMRAHDEVHDLVFFPKQAPNKLPDGRFLTRAIRIYTDHRNRINQKPQLFYSLFYSDIYPFTRVYETLENGGVNVYTVED